LIVQHKGERLTCRELSQRPAPKREKKKPVINNRRWKPAATHPWNQRVKETKQDRGRARQPDPWGRLAPATPARAFPTEKRKAG